MISISPIAGGDVKRQQSLWKTAWRFFIKLSIDLPYDPGLSLLGVFTNERNGFLMQGTV